MKKKETFNSLKSHVQFLEESKGYRKELNETKYQLYIYIYIYL